MNKQVPDIDQQLLLEISTSNQQETDTPRFSERVIDVIERNTQRVHSNWPFGHSDMDRTKLDLVIIDEKTKQPIGRPWLTFEICPFTNLVVGFHLSSTNDQGGEV